MTGGILGNISDLLEIPLGLGIGAVSQILLGLFGLSVGIFVGCLVMSLAETLKALPTISRRIRLAVGLQYVILAIALGKLAGSLVCKTIRRIGPGKERQWKSIRSSTRAM